jgi:hypothetical protein
MNTQKKSTLESIGDSKFEPLSEEESAMIQGGGVTVSVTFGYPAGPDVGVDYHFESTTA